MAIHPTDAALLKQVRDELRPGGHPIRACMGATPLLSPGLGLKVSNETLLNLEERLVRVERMVGLVFRRDADA